MLLNIVHCSTYDAFFNLLEVNNWWGLTQQSATRKTFVFVISFYDKLNYLDKVKATKLEFHVWQINATNLTITSAVCSESKSWVIFLFLGHVTDINGMTSDTAGMNLLWDTFVWKSSLNGWKSK